MGGKATSIAVGVGLTLKIYCPSLNKVGYKYNVLKCLYNNDVKRLYRLSILIGIALGAGAAIIYAGNYFISFYTITDFAAKATILGGILTFLGTIFTA